MHLGQVIAASMLLLMTGCAGGARPEAGGAEPGRLQRTRAMQGVQVDGAGLDASAFAASMSFLFPDETAELTRSLVRTEMARLEAARLDLRVPEAEVDRAFETFTSGLRAQLGDDFTLDDWSEARHGHPWIRIRPLYRRHLADNLLYQAVLRADAHLSGRVSMYWFLTTEESEASRWAKSLQAGRDPRAMLAESLLPGPEPDGSYPPVSVDLPAPIGPALRQARTGQVLGPLQLEGDRSWRVGVVREVLPPRDDLPPVAVLLQDVAARPIDALEARGWFEKMSARYTATTDLPPFSGPSQAFEFLR